MSSEVVGRRASDTIQCRTGGPLRVAHFTDSYLPHRDGIVSSLHSLVTEHDRHRHTSLRVVPGHRGQRGDGLLQLPSLGGGPAGIRIAWPRRHHLDAVARFDPDVVHVHTPGPVGMLGVLAARRLGRPLVCTYHTDLHACLDVYRVPTWMLAVGARYFAHRLGSRTPARVGDRRTALLDTILALTFGAADAVLMPTAASLARIRLPVRDEQITVLPSAVSLPVVDRAAGAAFRRRYRLGDAPVVLFVGRISAEKNVELAVRAFPGVVGRVPGARLVLLGPDPQPRYTRRLLAADHAAAVVRTGDLAPLEVAAGYAAADVLAFPSCHDTQGLVLAEAALHAVPAVVTDRELVGAAPLQGAALAAPNTVDGYAAAVAGLLADPRRRAALGTLAQQRAADYPPRRYAAAVTDVYRRLLAGS